MYYQKLRENLFVDIDYPTEITKLIGEAEPWREFWKLPLETKKKFGFLSHGEHADPGYRMRSREEGRDDKEYFHLHPETNTYIMGDGLGGFVEKNKILGNFFAYTNEIRDTGHQFALTIAREMGKDIPALGQLAGLGKIYSVLRLLHYTNTSDIEIIAGQHFDRSLFTLHLYESGPGLQFLNWNMHWTDAPIANGKTVIFSGYQLERLTEGKLQKTWHRVVRKDDIKDRISMVLFVESDAAPDYPREARAQDTESSYTACI